MTKKTTDQGTEPKTTVQLKDGDGTAKAELIELNETELDTIDGGATAWPTKVTGPSVKSDSDVYGSEAPVRRRIIADSKP